LDRINFNVSRGVIDLPVDLLDFERFNIDAVNTLGMKLPPELGPFHFGGREKSSKYQDILWPDIFRPEKSKYFSNIKKIGKAGRLSAYELSCNHKLNGCDAKGEGSCGVQRG
jgi:hypothetical protein